MGLLQNISMLSAEPIKNTGGAAVQCIIRTSNNRPEQQLNKYFGLAGIDQKGGIPYGYSPPLQITMPIKEGGMSTYAGITGVSTVTNTLNMGINLSAPIGGIGVLSPALIGIAHILGSAQGSGTIQSANIQCPIWLSGVNALGAGTVATANCTALAACSSNLSGTGNVTPPNLNIITQMVASLSGSGNFTCVVDLVIYLVANAYASGTLESTMTGIQNMAATAQGQGTVQSAILGLLLEFTASLIGSGNVSAALNALILLSGSIAGSSSIVPDLTPIARMSSALVGNSNVTNVDLKTIAVMLSNMQGQGRLTLADIKTFSYFIANILNSGSISASAFGQCFMESDITSAGEMVTPQSCAQAVWAAVAAAFNEPGTMGSKMNSASAAGDPWTAEIPGSYAEGSAGAILEKIKKLVKDNQALILAK